MKRFVPFAFLLLLLAQLMCADESRPKNYMISVKLKDGHDKVRIDFTAPEKHRIYTYRDLKSGTVTFYTSSIGFVPADITVQQFDTGLDMVETLEMKEIIPDGNAPLTPLPADFKQILEKLPECPPYFPKDELTDRSMRFFITEIIREKILLNYQQEIPYSVQVEVESYEETEHRIHIRSVIYVARDSQKAIIIGKGGSAIKKLGMQARTDIEEFTGKKIFLELFVKVDKDWRDNEAELKRFGYEA